MPFSKYTVDPEQIEAMRGAFHRVCDVLRLNGDTDDQMTELLAMKIMELAKGGELDPERLCVAVLASLEPSPVDKRAACSGPTLATSYAGDWVTRSIRRRGEPAFR